MKRVLVIQHHANGGAGLVGEHLTARGIELSPVVVIDEERDGPPDFGAPTDWDGIVVTGAYEAVYNESSLLGHVGHELAFLADAHAADVPIFGICFGGQALATVVGGSVAASTDPECGWVMIDSDDEAVIPAGPWFAWHYDRFTLPANVTEVARNSAAPHAFVVGRSIGLQFHPEVTAEMIGEWFDELTPEYLAEHPVDRAAAIDNFTQWDDVDANVGRLVDSWLRLAATSSN
jgi:GMP synthase-like glutamine amidotransferase